MMQSPLRIVCFLLRINYWAGFTLLVVFCPLTHVHAQSGACVANGPDLDTTLSYIKAHENQHQDIYVNSSGIVTFQFNNYNQSTIKYMLIDCDRTRVAKTDTGDYAAWFECSNRSKCIDDTRGNVLKWRSELGLVTEAGDVESLGNLARSMSHMIYLLQQAYRKEHQNKDDPFAPQ